MRLNRAHIANVMMAVGAVDTARADANETVFFTRQLESIRVQVTEAEYPELKLRQLVPLEGGVDEGADTFTWHLFDRIGLARMGSNFADDIPDVEIFGSEFKSAIETIEVGYSYSSQDVRRAAKVNLPLVARKGIVAREAVERKAEHVGAHGDALRNVPGMLANSSVPIITSGVTGTWSGATPLQIYQDLMTLAYAPWTGSKQVFKPNAMVLSTTQYKIAATTPFAVSNITYAGESVLSLFKRSQDMIKEVDSWVECDGAAANGTNDRAMVYMKRPQTLSLIWPLAFESKPPQPKGNRFSIPCESRFGGVVIYQPLACAYCDIFT